MVEKFPLLPFLVMGLPYLLAGKVRQEFFRLDRDQAFSLTLFDQRDKILGRVLQYDTLLQRLFEGDEGTPLILICRVDDVLKELGR